MEYLIILLAYLSSLIITFGIRGVNFFILIKDLASEFYELDFDALKDDDLLEHFNFKKIDYKSFIPMYNIFKSIESFVLYFKNYADLCDDMEGLGIIFPMANFEIYEYQKNPTFMNLLKVLKKGRERRLKANYFEAIDKGEIKGQVYYEGEEDVDILDTTIDFSDMLISDVRRIVKTNDENNLFSNFIHQHNGKITVARTINNARKIEEYSGLSHEAQIAKLRELSEELIKNKEDTKVKKKTIF